MQLNNFSLVGANNGALGTALPYGLGGNTMAAAEQAACCRRGVQVPWVLSLPFFYSRAGICSTIYNEQEPQGLDYEPGGYTLNLYSNIWIMEMFISLGFVNIVYHHLNLCY